MEARQGPLFVYVLSERKGNFVKIFSLVVHFFHFGRGEGGRGVKAVKWTQSLIAVHILTTNKTCYLYVLSTLTGVGHRLLK